MYILVLVHSHLLGIYTTNAIYVYVYACRDSHHLRSQVLYTNLTHVQYQFCYALEHLLRFLPNTLSLGCNERMISLILSHYDKLLYMCTLFSFLRHSLGCSDIIGTLTNLHTPSQTTCLRPKLPVISYNVIIIIYCFIRQLLSPCMH